MRHIAMLSFVLLFFSFFAHSQVHDKIGQNAWEQCNLKCANNSNCKSECNNTKYFKFTTSDVRGMLLGFAAIQNCTIPDDYQKNFKFENCPPNAEMISKSCLDFNKQMMQSQITSVCTQKRQMAAAEQQRKDGATNSAQGQQPKEESKIDANLGKIAIKAAEQSWKDSKDKSKNESKSAGNSSTQNPTNEALSNSSNKDNHSAAEVSTNSGKSEAKNSDNIAQQTRPTNSEQTQTSNSQTEKKQDESSASNVDPATVPELKNPQVARDNAAQAVPVLNQSAKDVVKEVPGSETSVNQLSKDADGGGKTPPKTEITSKAEASSGKLMNEIDAVVSEAHQIASQGVIPWVQVPNLFSQFKNNANVYADPSKKACSSAAERAGFFCLESSSPGIKAAKLVMDAATPVIATMSAAQKSCSSTSNVTKFVGAGLAIANGVCVGSKFLCDSTCGKAIAQLAELQSFVGTTLFTAINNEYSDGLVKCQNMFPTRNAPEVEANLDNFNKCNNERTVKLKALANAANKLSSILAKEQKPELGTALGIKAKCQQHTKDIIALVANIAGLAKASRSAKECAEKLSTANAAITPAQYCDQIANKSSQFCKCQANNNAEGCPGNIASNLRTPNSNTDENGADVKSQGGHSQFAGGMKPVTPDSVNLGGLNSEGSSNEGNGDGSSKGNQNAGTSFGAGSGNGSGSGIAGNSGESVGSEDKKEVAPEKKKFSFGALFGLGGGSSSSGRSGSGRDSSGGLGEKDMSEIKRKIASEQLRSQISGASGKSNWEKVNERYSRNKATFLLGQ